MNDSTAPDGQPELAAIRQAARWLARLQADRSPAALEACLDWRRARPEHELAWQRMNALSSQFSARGTPMDPAVASDTLHRATARDGRRRNLKRLLGITGASALAWSLGGERAVRVQLADYRTATGERSHHVLPDGTRLALNTGSAVDIRFDDAQRSVVLRAGEIHVQTAADRLGRPFRVQTRAGTLAPVGTRFLVRELDDGGAVRLGVLEGAVDIRPDHGSVRIAAGRQADFSARAIDASVALGRSAAAWLNGMLVADRMPLRAFLHELGRYRPGILACDDAVAQLPVVGAFSIDDTDASLALLAQTLPLRLARHTRYWVRVLPA
ncbi:fec operon regulator FecR [Pigmentiphaga humi]|uniref:Fec operon regulator FecR n=1 Tax=Pigmentiphaga humi TaxID=2478468 RepID=A0A3P4AVQ0_9BURK|nr:FecR domain-containing protein [Pigmentiphaga humi]VCU68093.1 fec operon regulator FecR [Pigmentiphaga humi]